MKTCEICGNKHNGNTVHRFVGEGVIELMAKKEAQKLIAEQRNPNWGFTPAPK